MISAWWLLLIIPVAFIVGMYCGAKLIELVTIAPTDIWRR